MTNFKTTKRALLSGVVALFICFTMLLGTTFAWFTDSVTSSNNIIQTGTLDISMDWAEGDEDPATATWTDASTGAIFNNDKWEPGYVEAKHVKIANKGTLALKYKLSIVPKGTVSKLAEVIDVYFVKDATQITREMLASAIPAGTLAEMIADTDGAAYGYLLAQEEITATIVLKMRDDAGNEYQKMSIGSSFAIQLLATQYTYEEDGFDNQYDKDIEYYVELVSATELYNSTLYGGSVKLGANLKTSDSTNHYNGNREYAIRDSVEYTIDLNGRTLDHDSTYQNGSSTGYTYLYTVAYNGKLIINGNGVINSANSEGSACIVYAQFTGEVVINNGEFNVDKGIAVWAGEGSKVTINGGSFISTGSDDEELIYSSGGIIDIYGGFFHNTLQDNRPVNVANANRGTGFITIYGGTFVNFDPSTGGDDPNNIKVAEGYKVVSETQANGDVWYTVVAE